MLPEEFSLFSLIFLGELFSGLFGFSKNLLDVTVLNESLNGGREVVRGETGLLLLAWALSLFGLELALEGLFGLNLRVLELKACLFKSVSFKSSKELLLRRDEPIEGAGVSSGDTERGRVRLGLVR